MCRGEGVLARADRRANIQDAQVSPDLKGASLVLSTARRLRHSAFSHHAGPLALTTSAYVCCLFLLPPKLERNLPGVTQLHLLMRPEFPLSGNNVENTDNVFDRSA